MTQPCAKVFFDGGCRPNPGPIEAAVVIRGQPHYRAALGHGSNHDAEWLALLWAVRLAQDSGLTHYTLIGDAREVIIQAQHALTTGQTAHPHAAALLAQVGTDARPRVRWVKRQQNLAGIALAARHPR
ncbi:reverse transcriptase-like protein [Novosphingobium sp. FSY-8]|uniref:Reverse transcriptase-like protein n=1 Tax=Novosphingobium ovatum TaxID=1908523 RepID=A0ABW9XDQ2_9SPHN|nr:reverse transcriptase-like protein [Novosphingobium ovatum]NBC36669.1 reverse transcriptase-like protein [Novosphingobium ovatum]